MRLISRKTLIKFWEKYRDSEQPLKTWAKEVENVKWKTSNEIVAFYNTADPIKNNRIVFNIKGNDYRLVAKIHYNRQIVYVRFIGTHAQYNRINAEEI